MPSGSKRMVMRSNRMNRYLSSKPDKVTLEVTAEASGTLHILVAEGETVSIGTVVGTIDAAEAVREPASSLPATPPPAIERDEKKEAPTPSPRAEADPAVPGISPDISPDTSLAPSVRRLVAEKNLDVAQNHRNRSGGADQQGRCASLFGAGAGRHS